MQLVRSQHNIFTCSSLCRHLTILLLVCCGLSGVPQTCSSPCVLLTFHECGMIKINPIVIVLSYENCPVPCYFFLILKASDMTGKYCYSELFCWHNTLFSMLVVWMWEHISCSPPPAIWLKNNLP